MPTTKTLTLYTFDELPTEAAREAARQWYREGCGPEDFDSVIEDAEHILGMLGVTLKYHDVPLMNGKTRRAANIWWQLGYCQSDGACFEGTYTYAKGAHRTIRAHAPKDTELHRIADALLGLQRTHGYKLYAVVRQANQGMYPEVETDADGVRVTTETVRALADLMRDLCTWIYQQLRTEDEYRSANEQVDEMLCANEYTFRDDGSREDA